MQPVHQDFSYSTYFSNIGWACGVWIVMGIGATIHGAVYSVHLPATVPSHFNEHGEVDDWSSRGDLIATYMALVWGIGAFMNLLVLGIPRCPPRCVNAPNKQEILATPGGWQVMCNLVGRFLYLEAALVTALMILVFELMFLTGLNEMDQHARNTMGLVGFLLGVFANVGLLLWSIYNFKESVAANRRPLNPNDSYSRFA